LKIPTANAELVLGAPRKSPGIATLLCGPWRFGGLVVRQRAKFQFHGLVIIRDNTHIFSSIISLNQKRTTDLPFNKWVNDGEFFFNHPAILKIFTP
jgi:hypothetical protein